MTESPANTPELSPVKQALVKIRQLNTRLEEIERQRTEPIAITGIALRFPGANDPAAFWDLLENGVDAIREVPAERWNIDEYFSADPQTPGKMNTRWGGFLSGIDQFDAGLFGISPREAANLDPQQRLLLETAWEALERAGQSPEQLFGGSAGVFLGISNSDYYRLLLEDIERIDAYASTGGALSVAGGRLSYTLGIHGPNISIDTACSSSLVALHLACKSLRAGETGLALAAGVNLILSPELNVNFSIANMMAPDGRCKTFDAAANGYVRGEGCAVLVLKRLSDAFAHGDPILALIRGTAINHDGRSGGLTAPNGPAQTAVIRAALAEAGVEPGDVSYIEAHGTGTSLGDPIEIGALIDGYCQDRPVGQKLFVGSVKTNIGHLEAAAGIAGVIKSVLALQKHRIPPHLHLKALNPHIDLAGAPIEFPVQVTPWKPAPGKSLLCGISSFGLSGTNAHVILEEAPAPAAPRPQTAVSTRPLHLLTVSARDEAALQASAANLERFLETPQHDLGDVCYSANTGRSAFTHRLAVVGDSADQIRDRLSAYRQKQETQGLQFNEARAAVSPEITFLFTGQGSNYAGMGRGLYQTQPVFHSVIDTCAEILRPRLDRPLLAALYPDDPDGAELIKDMRYGQPALFALQTALAALWKSWGIEATFAAGHSLGEYAAACMAGVFSLEDALKLVSWRGRLMQSVTRKGLMAALFAPEEQVAAAIAPFADRISIAARNAPTNIVISGEYAPVDEIVKDFEARGIKTRRLAISQAAHSPLIEPVLDEFTEFARAIHYSEPRISLVSTLTGHLIAPGEITDPLYWRRHLRQPVQFMPAINTLDELGQRIFLEIGPDPVLLSLGNRCLPGEAYLWAPSLRENRPDWEQMLESLGVLWTQGVKVDWEGFDQPYPRKRVMLPTYPFQHARYWLERSTRPAPRAGDPVWNLATAAAEMQSQQGPLDLQVSTYAARWDLLDRLTLAYILAALRQLGAFTAAGESWNAETLLPRFKIQPTYHSLMQRWLEKLAAGGLLQPQDGSFTNLSPLPTPDLPGLRREAAMVLADTPMLLEYVQGCGERLAAVITGATSPLETLFPGGSSRLAEDLYQNWAGSRYYAALVRAATNAAVQNLLAKGQSVRILELGAGTGATTSHVLPVLPADGRCSYTFTDISDLFLSRAAEKFAQYPYLRYATLDVEKDPAGQGFPLHSFDLLIATNVLHAVPSLRQALRHALDLLSPGGILILNEGTTHLSWFDITTGLIEGWQSFKDDLRSTSPLIPAPDWMTLLSQSGFGAVAAYPRDGSPASVLGQHVILAQAPLDGVDGRSGGGLAGADLTTTAAAPSGPAVAQSNAVEEWLARFQAALSDERKEIVLDFVRQKLGRVLRIPNPGALGLSQRFMDLGLDSLMALELRTQLCKGVGLPEKALSATLAFDYPNLQALTGYLLAELLKTYPPADESQPKTDPASNRERELADLSDAEVEALLLQKLNRQKGA